MFATFFTVWLPFLMGLVCVPLGDHIDYEPLVIVGAASLMVSIFAATYGML